jgi:hypothetical protein
MRLSMYNRKMQPRHAGLVGVLATVGLLFAGCAAREVEKELKVIDVRTGWYDLGIVEGQNKLVPSVSLKLTNISAEPIGGVEIQALFRRVDEDKIWGDHFIRAIGRDGLDPAATTSLIVLRSPRGYTGSQSRLKMLESPQFVDARVSIFGKQGSRNWVKMGEFPIDRQLLTE